MNYNDAGKMRINRKKLVLAMLEMPLEKLVE